MTRIRIIKKVEVDLEKWVKLTGVSDETIQTIESKLLSEIEGGPPTSMRPLMDGEALKFTQVWGIFIDIKEN